MPLSRPQFLDCTKTGWTRNSVKCKLCVDTAPLSLWVGAGLVHTHGYRAPHRLTWQSTIILSLGSSSPAPGRGPGLAEAARLGPRAAQRGVRLPGSWRGLRSPPGPELRGPRQCCPHCLRRASPRLAALLAVGASLLGSAGAHGARDGWAETEWPRPGPAQLARRCEGRAPVRELRDALGLLLPTGAGGWTWDVGLVSTARRAHVTPPSRAHAPRTESFSGLVSCVSQPSRLRCTSTLVGFRFTVTGANSGWT